MRDAVASGWYGDPTLAHEVRYWDGNHWTASVSDHGTVAEDALPVEQFGPPGSGDRLALWALAVLFVGGAAALAATVAWSVWTKTSSTLDTEDRVWGWTAVVRELPTAVLAWSVPVIAMVLAVRSCRRGSSLGRGVIVLAGAVLFVVSLSVINEAVQSYEADSRPELKWLLLPLSIAIAVGATLLALRAASRQPDTSR